MIKATKKTTKFSFVEFIFILLILFVLLLNLICFFVSIKSLWMRSFFYNGLAFIDIANLTCCGEFEIILSKGFKLCFIFCRRVKLQMEPICHFHLISPHTGIVILIKTSMATKTDLYKPILSYEFVFCTFSSYVCLCLIIGTSCTQI